MTFLGMPHRMFAIAVVMASLMTSCGDHQLNTRSLSVGATPVHVTIDASLKQPVVFTNSGGHLLEIKATDPQGNQDTLIFLGPGQTYRADPANVRSVQVSQDEATGSLKIQTEYPSKVKIDQ